MNRKFLAAALVAPLIAFGPTAAFAHHCGSKHHHHHARGYDQTYGSSKSMHKRSGTGGSQGSSSQDLNQGTGGQTGGGSTDQGASGSSKSKGI